MKKKLFVAVLALVCLLAFTGCCFHSEWYAAACETPKTCVECGETEGEALGHTWNDATCTAPRTCETCRATEGEALGHTWQEATTEAPKTCSTCAATEGERIITDERFTTAATSALYGSWAATLDIDSTMLGLEGFEGVLTMNISMDFHKDGIVEFGYAAANKDEFNQTLRNYTLDSLNAEFAAMGLDEAAADEAMLAAYGMTTTEYVDATMEQLDFATIFESFSFTGVYYVEGSQLYTGMSWNALEPSEFTVEGDTLTLAEEISGLSEESLAFTREAE